MPSRLILDRTDKGIDDLVKDWVNGESYRLIVDVIQDKSDPKTAEFDVAEVVNETPEETEGEEEGEYPAEKPKGKAGKPSILISFSKH